MGFSDCSSVDSSKVSSSLNLKATELRLGLPGSESPERDPKLVEKPLFPLQSSSGNKRGFSHTTDEFSESGGQPVRKEILPLKGLQLGASGPNESSHNQIRPIDTKANNPPAAKAQVVGWPPIRSFRRNTLCKNNDELDRKPGPGALFVKVSMDGAPYLRKVDLRTYSVYQELSSALEKMFSCFTIGQCGSHGAPGREMLSERKLRDLLHGSEYVLTYEDKDGDWMLVGDVPWEMFIESCKRMRIMKSSDAIGLAPRAMEKEIQDGELSSDSVST